MPNTYRKVYPGVRSGGFEVVTAEGELNLVVNAYYDESTGNWYRIDESKPAWKIALQSTGDVAIQYAIPGSGAIVWKEKLSLASDGGLYLARIMRIWSYSQDTEPDIAAGRVALWEDTSTGKYWFIWDCGGVQRKVELT